MEKIIETKTCKNCWSKFKITDRDLSFYDKISPIINWEKYQIPSPSLCPDCRTQRRLSFGNERKLYKRKCDLTGKDIISIYSPDKPYKVYWVNEWFSDDWDSMANWMDFDFSKTFSEQFNELSKKAPILSLFAFSNENSDYVNYSWWDKNCYLCVCTDYSEDCQYCYNVYYSKYAIDSSYSYSLENCYSCIDCKKWFKLFYSQNCENCSNSSFLLNCTNCQDCFACTDMVNAQYCFFNQKYDKETYLQKVSQFNTDHQNSIELMISKIIDLRKDKPVKYRIWSWNENVIWNYLFNSQNCIDCFDSINTEDAKYCSNIKWWKNLMDVNRRASPWELLYECIWVGANSNKSCFNLCSRSNLLKVYYSFSCIDNCNNLFWCVWLREKSYCIFNKQYTKQEYEQLLPKIIKHMQKTWERWEYFNPNISMFGYNETVAMEHFPLTKQEAIDKWFKRSDYEAPLPNPNQENVVVCKKSWKPFRMTQSEVDFYQKYDILYPTKHPDIRHQERMKLRNPRKLRDRNCDKCWKDIQTTYSPDRSETIYCEVCYNQEIY